MGQERVSGGQPSPHLKGPQSPLNFWDLLRARTQYEKWQPNFAWWSVIKLDVSNIFTRSNADVRSVSSS